MILSSPLGVTVAYDDPKELSVILEAGSLDLLVKSSSTKFAGQTFQLQDVIKFDVPCQISSIKEPNI
jgi:hypothetical protein